ncbi:hypothetical protein [Luteolibacter luteus]|uniref:Uncharacterized protein n=1 Tax=Luteolibacter luteus TaxID=2728835 RepID=A0A858RCH2_9BACT|nr:hypothetical protein [Luteolibacter luteus]QJE94304.1 hypothetical protein HHL09_00390 [Luteolibacter luteus]
MRFRLHRSLLFWLGLPGFLFILWSWKDSITHRSGLIRTCFMTKNGGTIGISETLGPAHCSFRIQKLTFNPKDFDAVVNHKLRLERVPHSITGAPIRIFPPFKDITPPLYPGDFDKVRLRQITIPHWAILLSYGLGWSGLIAWRRHRVNRAWEKHTAPMTSTSEGL